ncbi:MAG: MFS transporter [Synergistales bacterium]|nr:MFS transporter [Synergistales bacterium]
MSEKTPGRVPGTVWLLGLVSMLNDTASEILYPILPAFLSSVLGLSPAAIGLIDGASKTVEGFTKGIGGVLAQRFGRSRRFMLAGYAVSSVAKPFHAFAGSFWGVLGLRITDRVGKGMRSAPRDAIIAGSVPQGMLGRAFSLHRALDTTGAVVGPLLAFLLMGHFGDVRQVFLWTIIPGALCVIVASFVKRDSIIAPGDRVPFSGWFGVVRDNSRFRFFLFSTILFTIANSSDLFLLMRTRELGLTETQVPLVWMLFNVTYVLAAYPIGLLADRVGRSRLYLGGFALYAVVYAGFALDLDGAAVWMLMGLYGIYYGVAESLGRALVSDFVKPEMRPLAYGIHHFAVSIGALPANILFGFLWQTFGAPSAFLAGAAFSVLAGAVFLAGAVTRRS